MGQGLPPEFEDRVHNRPQPPAYTPIENRWWAGIQARRKQLQGYLGRRAARHKRPDALRDLILRALETLGPDAPAKNVLHEVQKIDNGEVIQEVTADSAILWKNPVTGSEKTTPYASFQNRLSLLRKQA